MLEIYHKPVKARNASYEWTILHAQAWARQEQVDSARTVYSEAIQRSDLDWPEAVYQAYELFENVHGTFETLTAARKAIDHEKKKVARRREKQAAQEQAAAVAQYQAAVAAAPAAEGNGITTAEPMAVDGAAETAAAVAPAEPAAKKEEPEADHQVKRDREHTTVLVSGLKKGTEPSRLEEYFGAVSPLC